MHNDGLHESNLSSIAVLIPALNPSCTLEDLVLELSCYGFLTVIVVNDGSGATSKPVFDRLLASGRCDVLEHAVNLGKGRALKTGLNHFLVHYPDHDGVITIDADGQHRASDAVAIARKLRISKTIIIGTRRFSGSVPLRSQIGNTITRYALRFVTGQHLYDTQSGLRGIPKTAVPLFLPLPGERYEYEMNMLLTGSRHGFGFSEIPIPTIYLDGNRSSHFNPLRDSMQIYMVLLRFYSSSLIASLVDLITFYIAYAASHQLFVSLAAARVLSSFVNFSLNRSLVFKASAKFVRSVTRYYMLFALVTCLSYLIIRTLSQELRVPVLLAKILTDTVLSLLTFSVQRIFVFDPNEERLREQPAD